MGSGRIDEIRDKVRRRTVPLRHISEHSGIGLHWLKAFVKTNSPITNPGFARIEALELYFTRNADAAKHGPSASPASIAQHPHG